MTIILTLLLTMFTSVSSVELPEPLEFSEKINKKINDLALIDHNTVVVAETLTSYANLIMTINVVIEISRLLCHIPWITAIMIKIARISHLINNFLISNFENFLIKIPYSFLYAFYLKSPWVTQMKANINYEKMTRLKEFNLCGIQAIKSWPKANNILSHQYGIISGFRIFQNENSKKESSVLPF